MCIYVHFNTSLFLAEPFVVAFLQTVYTVFENEGSVEVCVNLTHPGIHVDILDETIRVNVISDENSIYIPTDAILASTSYLYRLL